jgi:cardiolipin synthase
LVVTGNPLVFHWLSFHSLVAVLGLVVYTVTSHTRKQRRHPSAGIAWVLSLVLLPYITLPLYLLLGSRKVIFLQQTPVSSSRVGKPADIAAALGLPDAVSYEQLAIHQDGLVALNRLRQVLTQARQTIDLCSFLLASDPVGDEIVQLLMQRARAGVRVRLLLDGLGYYMGGHPDLSHLRAAGVQVSLFVSPLRSALRGRTNLRNHRKMLVADGRCLWCGGRNLAAEYFVAGSDAAKPAWIDLSFDLQGALATQAQQQFNQDWIFATQGLIASTRANSTGPAPALAQQARLVASGPDQSDDTIYTLLVSGCFKARDRILAVTPYFVPDAALLTALTLAARRGVAVDLLLPRQSNHRLADLARHAALRELASSGARVWLFPDMIHAKAVIFDNELALVGTANLDERSLLVNYELMVAFYEPCVVEDFARWIGIHKAIAERYQSLAPGPTRELLEGLVRLVAFQL